MATFDMQSILQLPSSELGQLYYKHKLVLHNFTIYECKKLNNGFCYLWPEMAAKASRSQWNWLRNQYVCALLLYAVKTLPINIIEHKFLVKGHTMMDCDSMHSAIEYAQKIYPYTHCMSGTMSWKDATNPTASKHCNTQTSLIENLWPISSLQIATNCVMAALWIGCHFVRCVLRKHILIRFSLKPTSVKQSSLYCCRIIRRSHVCVQYKLTRAYKCELPISAAKHKYMTGMISDKVIPESYRQFYESLLVCPQAKDYAPAERGDDNDVEADD